MSPSVSIIVPTHDRAEHLARTVESILSQTRLPDEVIIIDDGREDVGPEIGRRVADAGVKFLYRKRQPPSATVSRNLGMSLASGDILILGEDDVIYPPDHLQRVLSIYEGDIGRRVGGVGVKVVETGDQARHSRVWDLAMRAVALGRPSPRRWAARYVALSPAIARQLVPAGYLRSGAMSIRRCVAERFRFEESYSGYTQNEDMEFSYRVGREFALFYAPDLAILHDRASTGRPDTKMLGRTYARRVLEVTRGSVEDGAGTRLLVAYNLVGMTAVFLALACLGRHRKEMLLWAVGIMAEGLEWAGLTARRLLCGC